MSAETQEGVFLPIGLVGRLPQESLLRAVGDERWMSGEPAKVALSDLVGLASDAEERLAVSQAMELVDHAIATGTGVADVPPAAGR